MIACYGGAMAMFDLLAPLTAQGGSCTLPDAEDWTQGRTLYGGASALIAYTAAIRAFPDLPPLRAGQLAIVAPSIVHAEWYRPPNGGAQGLPSSERGPREAHDRVLDVVLAPD